MSRKLLRGSVVLVLLFALPLLVPPAAAQGAFQLSTPYPAVAVEAGSTVTFNLTVSSAVSQRVNLAVTSVPEGWTAELRGGGFVVDAVFAGADSDASATLDVDVPEDASTGVYEIVVTGSAGDVTATLPLNLRVAEAVSGTAELRAEFPSLRGASDTTFTFNLELQNNGPEEQTFSLEAAGPQGWQVTARPASQQQASTATVAGGQSEQITVEANPPDDVPAGEYEVAVRALGGGQTAEATLTVEITGNYAFTLATADERLNVDVLAGRARRIPLLLTNDGTAALQNVELSATPPSGWEVTFEPESVPEVPPGETAQVEAIITPSGEAIAGDYVVTLTARVPETSQEMELRTTVQASRLWGALGLLLIALALGGLAAVFRRYGRR